MRGCCKGVWVYAGLDQRQGRSLPAYGIRLMPKVHCTQPRLTETRYRTSVSPVRLQRNSLLAAGKSWPQDNPGTFAKNACKISPRALFANQFAVRGDVR